MKQSSQSHAPGLLSGRRKARSRWNKRRRGGGESAARHRPRKLDGLGRHDIHRGEAEGGEGGEGGEGCQNGAT